MAPKIGVLYKKRGNFVLQEQFAGPGSVIDTTALEVAHHETALVAAGYPICRIDWSPSFVQDVMDAHADLVFNVSTLVEAAILEELGIPYVGSQTAAIVACTDKALAKKLWQRKGLPTAPFHVARCEDDCAPFRRRPPFDYPLFVKPVAGRGSSGIDETSIIGNYQELVTQVERRLRTIGQPVLIEPFLQGREIKLGIVGNGATARVLPPMEIVLPKDTLVVSFAVKEALALGMAYDMVRCPAPLTDGDRQMMRQMALQAYDALGCIDYARLDTIFTEAGPFLLEANSFAGLSFSQQGKPSSSMSFMAHAEGMRGQEFLDEIVQAALRRLGMPTRAEWETLIPIQSQAPGPGIRASDKLVQLVP